MMHYTIKLEEVKKKRDEAFAEYWRRESDGIDSPHLDTFCECAEHAFQAGFLAGFQQGSEHGALLVAAAFHSDVSDIISRKLTDEAE